MLIHLNFQKYHTKRYRTIFAKVIKKWISEFRKIKKIKYDIKISSHLGFYIDCE